MENLGLISEMMTYESRGDKRAALLQERGGRTLPHGGSRTRICIEAYKLSLLVAGTEIRCWGSRKQRCMELILDDLIKGRWWYTLTWEQNKQSY